MRRLTPNDLRRDFRTEFPNRGAGDPPAFIQQRAALDSAFAGAFPSAGVGEPVSQVEKYAEINSECGAAFPGRVQRSES